jgi:hypothetical protein
MVANQGKITNLAGTPSTGLVDGTDKLHSGILKTLESFSQGDMCISHAGFTITGAGTYTQYNLAQPIKFTSKGQYVSYTSGNLTVVYSSTVADASNDRYDWVLLNPAIGGTPSIVIVQGTAASAPLVADITAGYIPIALVKIDAGSANNATSRNFQLYTMSKVSNSLSIGYNDSGYTESGNITGSADGITIKPSGDVIIQGETTDDVSLTVVNNKDAGDGETATLRLQSNRGTDSDFEIVHDVFGHTTIYSNQPDTDTNAHIKFTDTPAVIINPNVMDMDFQVASDSVSNMLYVNAGTDRVGIGTNSPSSRLEIQGGLTTTGSVLTLSTMETSVVADDVLGRINFQAPLEASGTDAVLPGASIHALATDTFAADNNETAIVLSTASSDAEGTAGGGLNERMRITSAGNVGIGTSSPTEMLHLSDADASEPTILIENTGTSTTEPNLIFSRTGSHPSDPTVDIGRIGFQGDNDADQDTLYAAITGDAHVATDSDERGRMRFHVMRAGAITEVLRLGGFEVCVNESSNDVDFRVEGNTVTNLLKVNAGADTVGIGSDAPDHTLTVNGTIARKGLVRNVTTVIGASGPPTPLPVYSVLDTDDLIIASAPSGGVPPNSLDVQLPDAGAEDIGRTYRIVAIDVAAGLTINRTGSDDVFVDEVFAGISLPFSLSVGKVYDITCVDTNMWMVMTLN